MLKRLFKSKKAQNTAEYAILISLVVAGIVAMQTYAQRALQARVKDASGLMTSIKGDTASSSAWSGAGGSMNQTKQYEPYYLSSNYESERTSEEFKSLGQNGVAGVGSNVVSNRFGNQKTLWNANDTSGW